MNPEFSNLSLFAFALLKCGALTGILPAVFLAGLVEGKYHRFEKFVLKFGAGALRPEQSESGQLLGSNPRFVSDSLSASPKDFLGIYIHESLTCVKVEEVEIRGRIVASDLAEDKVCTAFTVKIDGLELSPDEHEAFARRDGFGSFADMMKFWDGRLPFRGHIIHWSVGKSKFFLRRVA